MDFAPTPRVADLQKRLVAFMQDHVLPAEAVAHRQHAEKPDAWGAPAVMADLKAEARSQGLWNLFLPPHAVPGEGGRGAVLGEGLLDDVVGLTNVEYAPLAELTGWSPLIAPEALNCNPPDTGNMELLVRFGTPAQQEQWLRPLLAGEIRGCFSMTEPDVASSDASNVRLEIADDGDAWVLNGRKWWSTAALRPDCAVSFVMGVTDPDAAAGRRHSIVLVPMDTPGVEVVRSTTVMGFEDRHEGGHGEIVFTDVRVPKENLLGDRGAGFAVAQARLGPGRIHHCMRLIGMAERAIALMAARSRDRVAFGSPLAELGMTQLRIAEARTRIDAARLLVLHAAWKMDVEGPKAARHDIAAAKIMVPRVVKEVVDDAIQVFGGAGVSQDTMLPVLHAQARFLQIADGPDDVHRRSLARAEVTRTPVLQVTS